MNDIIVVNGVPSIIIDGQTMPVPSYVQGHEVENDFGRAGGLPTISAFSTTTFKIRIDDQEKVVQAPLKVIILGITPKGLANNRAYYKDQYVPGQITAPDCASSTGIFPDEGDLKQSATCAACPQAVFGSSVTGKGQACSQGKTMFVTPASDKGVIYQVRVAPTSLKSVAAYGAKLTRLGVPSAMVVTHLGLIPETESQKTYPILKLDLASFLEQTDAMESLARSKSAEITSLIVDTSQVQAQPAAPVQPVQPPLLGRSTAAPVQPEPIATGFEQAPVVQTQPATKIVTDGFGQEFEVPTRTQQPEAQVQTGFEQAPAQTQQVPPPTEFINDVVQPQTAAPEVMGTQPGVDLDSEGQPWSAELHSSGKTKIKNGTWKKKKGAAAPVQTQPVQTQPVQTQPVQTQPVQTGGGDALTDVLSSWA